MRQGQLLKEPTSELNQLSLPTSIPGRDQFSQGATIASPSIGFTENTKMKEVTQAYFAKESLVVMEEMEEEDEKEGHWEVLGRGEARLPKHLGSSEVRDENTMLFIANFVVDASCCSNLL